MALRSYHFSMRPLFAAVLFPLIITPAQAGSAGMGSISDVIAHHAGVFFELSSPRISPPACATQNRWFINSATNQGQAMIAVLLTAQIQGKRVGVVGTGYCDVWADTETVDHFFVEN